MAKMTIAEAKAAAAKAADEAVTLGEKIREKIKDETVLEFAETAENLAIEKAGEAEEKTLLADINAAADEAILAVEKLKNILSGEIITSGINESDTENQNETQDNTLNKVELQKPEEIKSYVYIGPSVKHLGIRENAIYRGTKTDVLNHLKEAIEEIPHIGKMIFETSEIAEKKKKAKEKGNSIYNAYETIKKAIKK
ncbi:MAG: hypothetical protein LKJ25_06125 [Clostridia bacterium]|jgi:hypothetical protein|nr:hypothetical protein [Clostridia bacterium]